MLLVGVTIVISMGGVTSMVGGIFGNVFGGGGANGIFGKLFNNPKKCPGCGGQNEAQATVCKFCGNGL